MLYVINAIALPGYKLRLTFNDGAEGVADVGEIEHTGVFEGWKDHKYFDLVRVDDESGTVVWPSGADLDPYVLYSKATGVSIEQLMNLDA
jgi:hypothetical protein